LALSRYVDGLFGSAKDAHAIGVRHAECVFEMGL